ncbi:hypothetical protein H2200_004313 [Cladophialophora chaetospira]|uniref:Uncharacterized protein n=1 Tax=Cladophialophora chaetospira TaxID=386627 RepID=A0AA38XD00_9EURO|nr:hypothetical protein H2200_004313 [Cladophialophora chaetospira]
MADLILKAAVKGVASGIGLVSEGIHHHKERKLAKEHLAEDNEGGVSPDDARSGNETHQGGLEEGDEEHWDLDNAQDELMSVHSNTSSTSHSEEAISKRDQINPTKITDAFIRRHPAPLAVSTLAPEHKPIDEQPDLQVPSKLPLPVILPQRRPKARVRGFIRAYAPDLNIKGIDQETFLDFIETFNQASVASPYLDAINLAGFATLALPPGISQAVQLAIMVSVKIAKDIQSRKRQNTFLDRINEEFFHPRGLYCVVMTWQPDSPTLNVSVDITSTIADRMAAPQGTGAKIKRAMKSSSGTGNIEFTECAALIFPKLDELAVATGEEAETKKAKLKHYKGFADTYFDRRAQAKHAGKNPDSALAKLIGPTPKFTSRYADPNNPASSGNIWSLLSGGHFNPPDRRQMLAAQWSGSGGRGIGMGGFGGLGAGRTGMMGGGLGGVRDTRVQMISGGGSGGRQQMMGGYGAGVYGYTRDPHYMRQETYHQQPGDQQGVMPHPYGHQNQMGGMGAYGGPIGLEGLVGTIFGTGSPGGLNPIKRILSQNVLYLMIVNLPSEEELAAATHMTEHGEEH